MTEDSREFSYGEYVRVGGDLFCVAGYDYENETVELVPASALDLHRRDGFVMNCGKVFPVDAVTPLAPKAVQKSVVRELFLLQAAPWELAERGLYPFGEQSESYTFTDDDVLLLIDNLQNTESELAVDAWRDLFPNYVKTAEAFLYSETPGFSPSFLWRIVWDALGWITVGFDDVSFLIEVKEDYLKSRGQPLQETVVPEFYKSDLLVDLKNYAKRRPVTEEIREFYERLLEELYLKGETEDVVRYAYAYYGGNGIVPCDWKKSEEALLKLFDIDAEPPSGDEYAANTLGYLYYSNRLGSPDYEKAFKCFSYGARHGVPESIYKLSDMCRKGHGTEKDPEAAWKLLIGLYSRYEKGNQDNLFYGKHADVALRIGYCYRDGIGVEQDLGKAYEFFKEAEEAIQLRLKEKPLFGDAYVAQHIQRALESLKDVSRDADSSQK